MIHSKVFSPVCTPVHSSVLGHFPLSILQKAISRYFTTFDSVLQNYYVIANTIKLAQGGFFEFEFTAPTSPVIDKEYLTDGDNVIPAQRGWLQLNTTGNWNYSQAKFDLLINGVIANNGTPYPKDGKQYTATMLAKVDIDIKFLGSKYTNTEGFNGEIAKPKSNNNGVTTTFKLDKGVGEANDVETSAEGNNTLHGVNFVDASTEIMTLTDGFWVGDTNKVTNGNFSRQGTNWGGVNTVTTYAGDKAFVTGSTSNSRLSQGIRLKKGKTFRMRADITAGTAPNPRMLNQTDGVMFLLGEDPKDFVSTVTGNTDLRLRVDVGNATFDNVIVERIIEVAQ